MMTTPSPAATGKHYRPSGRLLALLLGIAALSAEALLLLGPARRQALPDADPEARSGLTTVLPAKSLPITVSSTGSGDTTTVRRGSSPSIRLVREDSDPAQRIRVPRRTPQASPAGIW